MQDVRCLRNTAGRYARELAAELRQAGHVVTPAVFRECQRAGRALAKAACPVDAAGEKTALQALGVLLAARQAKD